MQPSQVEAAAELLTRRRARENFLDFITYTVPFYKVDPFHALLAMTLQQVLEKRITRLMIFAPPQHGKSLLVSTLFPIFWLAHRSDDPIILTSYGADLAVYHSRNARALLENHEYRTLFPTKTLDMHSRAKDHWSLSYPNRGRMLAVGVGGPITGHGARLAIIDDPFENWEQAQNQSERNRVWDWYRGTFRTRVQEGGVIVLIMTRWHEDDLAARLMAEQSEHWTVLRLPAIAEGQAERDENDKRLGLPTGQPDPLGRVDGEPLSPQRFSIEALLMLQRDVGSQAWNSEYQGVPRALAGNRFKRAWFEIVEVFPREARYVRYWDKAATAGGQGAYTAGVLVAKSAYGIFYIVDVIRGRWSAMERDHIILQTAFNDREKYGEVWIWTEQEPGSGGKESAQSTVRQLAGFPVHAEVVTGSKDVRLEPYAAQAEAGNVKLVRAPWNSDYLEELMAVPNGRYRDQSDASGGAFNKLAVGGAAGFFL